MPRRRRRLARLARENRRRRPNLSQVDLPAAHGRNAQRLPTTRRVLHRRAANRCAPGPLAIAIVHRRAPAERTYSPAIGNPHPRARPDRPSLAAQTWCSRTAAARLALVARGGTDSLL